jgi:hypothetical protein
VFHNLYREHSSAFLASYMVSLCTDASYKIQQLKHKLLGGRESAAARAATGADYRTTVCSEGRGPAVASCTLSNNNANVAWVVSF